jgi:SAM-dependent methyltransferase
MKAGAGQYYDKIAHLYDIMYNAETGFDHRAQVQWVDDWREKLELPKTVLDLACGTGPHLACFEALGYECFGIDASRGMLEIAARRLDRTHLEKGFFHDFRLAEQVPLVTCFFNALSYNRNRAELRGALGNIHANLCDKGLLVFDLVCTTSAQPVFGVREFKGGGLELSRTFVGIPTKEGFESTIYYVVFDGASSETTKETTVRGTFTEDDVREALSDCGFTILYEGSGYSPITPAFVAHKQAGL